MKKNLFCFISALFLALLSSNSTLADVILPGYISVDYCFEIANNEQYSDYLFTVNFKSFRPELKLNRGSNRIINQNECIPVEGYLSYGEIYALNKAEIKPGDIVRTNNREEFKELDEKNTKLIAADLRIYKVREFPQEYAIAKIVDRLEIVSLTKDELKLRKQKVIFTRTDGSSEERIYENQDEMPLPSGKSQKSSGLIIMPILGLLIIGIIPALRKVQSLKRRERQ